MRRFEEVRLSEIDGDAGFCATPGLRPEELDRVTARIEAQWLEHLEREAPAIAERARAVGIARYHEIAGALDHASLWPKHARILPADAVAEIRSTRLFEIARAAFGEFAITAEEGAQAEEIYWRLVRPGQTADIGPLHADAWFWELGHGRQPDHRRRIKLWVAVRVEPGRNGLRVVPGSHRRPWPYGSEHRDGKLKPVFDEGDHHLAIELLPILPGDAVWFHDRLLHGGAPNRGSFTRVSFELTLSLPAARLP